MSTPDPEYVAIRQQIEDATADDRNADVTTLVEALHARYEALVRGANTPDGYPYPSPTDPLMEGADAIRALAEALAARTVTLTYTPANSAVLMTAYPLGLSLFTLASGSHATSGFPGSGGCTVLTIKNSSNQASQYVFPAGGSGGTLPWYRSGGATAWGDFNASSSVAGAVSAVTGAANATRTVTVTFPVRSFTGVYPQVVCSLATANGGASTINTEIWVGTTTTTSFNLGVNRSNATDVAVRWVATQMPVTVAAQALMAAALAAEQMASVTCPTEGCMNQGVPIEVATTWTDDEGVQHPVDAVVCGVCGATLTPVAITPPEQEG
jgi:hypothetical protein